MLTRLLLLNTVHPPFYHPHAKPTRSRPHDFFSRLSSTETYTPRNQTVNETPGTHTRQARPLSIKPRSSSSCLPRAWPIFPFSRHTTAFLVAGPPAFLREIPSCPPPVLLVQLRNNGLSPTAQPLQAPAAEQGHGLPIVVRRPTQHDPPPPRRRPLPQRLHLRGRHSHRPRPIPATTLLPGQAPPHRQPRHHHPRDGADAQRQPRVTRRSGERAPAPVFRPEQAEQVE